MRWTRATATLLRTAILTSYVRTSPSCDKRCRVREARDSVRAPLRRPDQVVVRFLGRRGRRDCDARARVALGTASHQRLAGRAALLAEVMTLVALAGTASVHYRYQSTNSPGWSPCVRARLPSSVSSRAGLAPNPSRLSPQAPSQLCRQDTNTRAACSGTAPPIAGDAMPRGKSERPRPTRIIRCRKWSRPS